MAALAATEQRAGVSVVASGFAAAAASAAATQLCAGRTIVDSVWNVLHESVRAGTCRELPSVGWLDKSVKVLER